MNTTTDTKLFVTGGSGFLGGHMLVQLYRSGFKIRAMIRKSSSLQQLRLICRFYGEDFEELNRNVEWVFGDTLDFIGLRKWMEGADEVYHCAALVSFNAAEHPKMLRTNIQGTANMVDAALECGVKKFCYISSIAALGTPTDAAPVREETPRKQDEKVSVYSESKFRSELEVWRGISLGLNAVIVNPGVILGPGNPQSGSLLLIKNGRKGIPFYTKATTGYVDVRDVCKAGILLMKENAFNRRYTLVSENAHNGRVFELIAKEYGKKAPRFVAGKSLLITGAILAWIGGKITGRTSQLTMETVRSAQRPQIFSNQRIKDEHGFNFIPLATTIHETCDFLKRENL